MTDINSQELRLRQREMGRRRAPPKPAQAPGVTTGMPEPSRASPPKPEPYAELPESAPMAIPPPEPEPKAEPASAPKIKLLVPEVAVEPDIIIEPQSGRRYRTNFNLKRSP